MRAYFADGGLRCPRLQLFVALSSVAQVMVWLYPHGNALGRYWLTRAYLMALGLTLFAMLRAPT